MTSPWVDSKTPVGPPTSANPTVRQLLYAAIVTGSWSGLICVLIYLIARLAGMDFTVTGSLAEALEPVTWLFALLVPLAFAVAFAMLAALIRGWQHAGRITYWAGTLAALVSLAGPLVQPSEVGWFTRIVLASMHVVTWFLVVPQIARIIGDSEPGQSVARDE